MSDFFMTPMGSRFFNAHVPEIIKSLQTIGRELKRANDLKEKELSLIAEASSFDPGQREEDRSDQE